MNTPRTDSICTGFARALLFTLALTCVTTQVSAQVPVSPETPAAADVAEPADASNAEQENKTIGIPTNPAEIVQALNWYFILPFLMASVLALWFGIERLVVLRQGRVIPKPFVQRLLHHLQEGRLDAEKALKLCEENGSPVASVFAHGIRKWGKPSVEVEQAIIDGGERQVSQLRKHLRIINGVANVTPLIGLLGTVIGMIVAFNDIANSDAMGKHQELAGGIALALLTTAAGLLVAIPALIIYTYLAGRVDTLVMQMDDLSQEIVQLISAEGLQRRATTSSRKSAAPAKEKRAV